MISAKLKKLYGLTLLQVSLQKQPALFCSHIKVRPRDVITEQEAWDNNIPQGNKITHGFILKPEKIRLLNLNMFGPKIPI